LERVAPPILARPLPALTVIAPREWGQ
jgi:hypothetical protein